MMSLLAEGLLAVGGSTAGALVAKVTAIAVLALVGSRLARRSRAAVRHVLLAGAFAVILVLPIASLVIPPVRLEVPIAATFSIAESRGAVVSMDVNAVPERGDAAVPVHPRTTGSSSVPASILLLGAWAAGALLFLSPVLAALWHMRSLRRVGVAWPHGRVIVRHLALDAGIHRRVDVLLHEAMPGPMTCGVLRPAIVLPPDAQTWTGEDLRRAIVHELEHVRRGDWVTQCVARALCAMYWFHPLVWIAWRQLALEAERACDDAVLRRAEATSYADQLIVLAQRLSTAAHRPLLAMANRDDLATRVRAVLDAAQARGRAGAVCVALTVACAAVLIATMAPLRAVARAQSSSAASQESSLSVESVLVGPKTGQEDVRATGLVSTDTIGGDTRDATARIQAASGITTSGARAPQVNDSRQIATATVDRQAEQADKASNAIPDRRLWVLLFDLASLQTEDLRSVVEAGLRWVNEATTASDMTAVVTIGARLTVVTDFTSSREELRAAFQSLGISNGTAAGAGTLAGNPLLEPAPDALTNAVRLRALTTLCETLAPIQQKKSVLYFSGGPSRTADDNVIDLRATLDACNRGNVTIYSVDARGLQVVRPATGTGGAGLFRGGARE